jgi:hypothetical protein
MSVKRFATFVAGGTAVAATVAGIAASTAAPAQAADQYAAIAYSPATGAYGTGYNASSRQQAEDLAMGACVRYGGTDCQIAAWVQKGCASLGVAADGAWQGEYAATPADADGEVRHTLGPDAKIIAQACSNYA